jgi:uncharacterized membrane protein YhiD involved in acid resistance
MESFLEQLPAWIEAFRFPVLGRLALATALGALVGLERELAGKPAGLRTNILICVGATLLTEASLGIATVGFATHELVRSDPGRIAAQIVSGIGFIGAGTILVARGSVLGLTTAATLWVVAAIGITVGIGAYVEAIGAADRKNRRPRAPGAGRAHASRRAVDCRRCGRSSRQSSG